MIKFERVREGVYSSSNLTDNFGKPLIMIHKMVRGLQPFPKGWDAAWYVSQLRGGCYYQWLPPKVAARYANANESTIKAMFPTLREAQAAVSSHFSQKIGLDGGFCMSGFSGLGMA